MSRDNRKSTQAREISIETNMNLHAEGSVLVKFGNTHVICTASIDNNVPRWMKGSDKGWVTAEYGMLPRSTNERMGREAARGKQSGRTQEIQRLIGRSLRSIIDLSNNPPTCCALCSDGRTNPSIDGDIRAIEIALLIASSADLTSTR